MSHVLVAIIVSLYNVLTSFILYYYLPTTFASFLLLLALLYNYS